MHRTSFMAPKHPKQEINSTNMPVIMRTYTEPAYKLVPSNSFAKDLSITVQIPKETTVTPPNYKRTNNNHILPTKPSKRLTKIKRFIINMLYFIKLPQPSIPVPMAISAIAKTTHKQSYLGRKCQKNKFGI